MSTLRRFRELTAVQRRAFAAAYLGWLLDGFDFYMFVFLITDIQTTFGISKTSAGAIGTATLLCRVIGGIAAGAAADRWGRKPVLAGSIIWYSGFAFLGGFAPSYLLLLAARAGFGIGMGGAWSAGLPLTLEHWPAHLRGTASGLLQGGYSAGVVLSALVYQLGCSTIDCHADERWRVFLWLGIAPALVGLWVMSSVRESPLWLGRNVIANRPAISPMGQPRPFNRGLVFVQTFAVVGTFQLSYQAMSFWYPTLLASSGRSPLLFVAIVNIAGIAGAAAWGHVSETRIGRRWAMTIAMGLGILATPLYAFGATIGSLVLGAVAMGFFAAGSLGIVPGYLAERFPTSSRGTGMASAYHSGAVVGAVVPFLIGQLQDSGFSLPVVMSGCIIIGGVLMILCVWLGPETRGRDLAAR